MAWAQRRSQGLFKKALGTRLSLDREYQRARLWNYIGENK